MKRSSLLCILALLLQCMDVPAEQVLFDRIQAALQSRDHAAYLGLLSTDPAFQNREREFLEELAAFRPTSTILNLAQSQDNQMRVQVLIQSEEEARFELWALTMGTEDSRTVITSRKVLSKVSGLYRLRLGSAAHPVRNLDIRQTDAIVRLESGSLFPITADGEITGAVFLGRGSLIFTPSEPAEQQQLGLFCKKPRLETGFQHYYVRASSYTLKKLLAEAIAVPQVVQADLYSTARDIARESNSNAFGVRVPFSDELWFPRIQGGDLYSEFKSDFGLLVYQVAPNEQEDILLAQKQPDRIISLYSSGGRRIRIGQAEDFRILSYKMNLAYDPGNTHLSGTTDILLGTRASSNNITFKLNQSLRVSSIHSNQGALLYFQEKTTNNLHIVLNEPLTEGDEIHLTFRYSGKIDPDRSRSEAQRVVGSGQSEFFIPPTYLYSSQALWYPQLLSKPYSAVDTVVEVPSGYTVVANGALIKEEKNRRTTVFTYSADIPVRYFSMLIGKLRGSLSFDSIVPIRSHFYDIDRSNASKQTKKADQLLRYYSDYFGRYPYRNLNLAFRPAGEPGGHAPAGIVITNRVFTFMRMRFERDPLWIPKYPEFLLAHELAHQWWGQAVGWYSYRDQWLSEGFAQFSAAEYVRSVHGDEAWLELSKDFQQWIEDKTHAGPIILGSRLGHLTEDSRAFSALLYNKGAYVLNMLKNWMGAENFKNCLAEFYSLYKFKRAEIRDFQEVAKRHSSEDLSVFFEQWLHRWTIPSVSWNWSVSGTQETPSVRLHFQQAPEGFFELKIPVEFSDGKGRVFHALALVNEPEKNMEIQVPFVPTSVLVDPLQENLMQIKQEGR